MATSSDSTNRSLKRKASYGDLVTVLIGNEKQAFRVHKEVLMEDSKYFRATFDGQFSEAEAKTVHIPDIDPQTFETYVHWMYSSEIVTEGATDITSKDDKNDKISYSGLVKLYAAADRLENTHLRNCVMTACLILSTCLIPGVATIQKHIKAPRKQLICAAS